MPVETWVITATMTGNFRITDEHRSEHRGGPIEGLRRLSITPDIRDDGRWSGMHSLEARLAVENVTSAPLEAPVVAEKAHDLVDTIAMLASVWTGIPVGVSGGVSAKRQLATAPPRYRLIMRPVHAAVESPPRHLPAEALEISMTPKLRRIARWWARGLSAVDGVDRLIALNNALDLLAGMEEGVPGRARRCESCGAEKNIGPGLRERAVHLLATVLGHPEDEATDIYESRIDLAHARSDLTDAELRKYRTQAQVLEDDVRRGIGRTLQITLPLAPQHLPVDLPSSVLDVVYEENTDDKSGA